MPKTKNRNRPKTMQTRLSKILTKEFLIKEYLDLKKSPYTIGKEINCSPATIRYRLKKIDLYIRNHSEAGKCKPPMTEEHRKNICSNHAHLFGKDNPNYGNHKFSKEKAWGWKGGEYKGKDGYYYIYAKSHPNPVAGSYIKRATFIMEQKIGRYLTKDEVVHHINGIKDDDRIQNLCVMTKSEHSKFHFYNTMNIDKKTKRIIGKKYHV